MAIEIQNAVKAAKMPETIKNAATAKYVLLTLADRADAVNAECWPSQDLIAWETELSSSTVKRSIKALSASGLIQVKTGWRSGRKHNSYRINIQLLHSLKREPLSRSGLGAPASEMLAATSKVIEESSGPITEPESSVDELPTDETECAVDQLPPDEYPRCIDAIRVLRELNAAGYNFYTGPLRWSEWYCCESAIALAISEAYIDLEEFLTNWAMCRSQGFRKAPSLPNIFPETMNGVDMENVILHQNEDFEVQVNSYEWS